MSELRQQATSYLSALPEEILPDIIPLLRRLARDADDYLSEDDKAAIAQARIESRAGKTTSLDDYLKARGIQALKMADDPDEQA
jgi:hypothetical protein